MRVLRHVMGLGLGLWWGGMLTFMLTCGTCACYVTSWVWGWGGVGMLTFMLTVGTCACYVTWKAASESAARILASQALNFVKQSPTKKTMLITDGAPCYPSLSAKFGWRHEACNHSKGISCIKKRMEIRRVDAMWRLPKSAIPCSLATRVNSRVNPKLMRSIRVWQWRWLNSKENLLEKTGRTSQKRMAMWEREKNARVFKTKFTANYRTSSEIHLIFPGKIQPFLCGGSVVSLWRKRHFFFQISQNIQNAGAVFLLTGCLWTLIHGLISSSESIWQRLGFGLALRPAFICGRPLWLGRYGAPTTAHLIHYHSLISAPD